MAIREILPVEQQTTETRTWDVLKNQDVAIKIVQDLDDTLASLPDRLWLTTTEIGIEERAIAVKFKDDIHIFMNPVMLKKDKMIIMREKCPVDGKEYFIPRYTELSLNYQDSIGKILGSKMNEAASIVVHEALDALDTVYACDYGLEVTPEFDAASDDDKAEVLAAYRDSINKAYKSLDEDLMNNEEVKRFWSDAKFIKGVADGTIQTEHEPISNRAKKRLDNAIKLAKQQANKMKFWSKK